MMIEGYIARLMYTSLYKTHELALHGYTKVALDHAGTAHHPAH